ncbi:type II secretion system F family protein [Candidatus Woesearchaeota archaeon]|nr:type II secretion system F family protein [Candidatus Woesearchaeota archaeon]
MQDNNIKIPFLVLPIPILEKLYRHFLIIAHLFENTLFANFTLKLQQAKLDANSRKYIAYCVVNDIFAGIIFGGLFGLFSTKAKNLTMPPLMIGILCGIFFFFFMMLQQRAAPEVYIKKRIDSIEQNTLPALQNILIQLRSGIPLFDVLVNVAASDYGEVSKEIMGVVKKINGGIPQVEALERMALENPSSIFRSAIWQMVNGMKTGSNLSDILRDIMNELAEEQLLQVEEYGATLSPLTMFYMIMGVILPAIGVNFLIVIAAFMNLDPAPIQGLFWGVLGMNIMTQMVFINIIRTKRPALLKT